MHRVSLVMVAATVWTVLSLALWGFTAAACAAPGPAGAGDGTVLAVAAGTAAVIAAVCWTACWVVRSRQNDDREKNMPLIRTLIAAQRPAPGEEPGREPERPPALRVVRRR